MRLLPWDEAVRLLPLIESAEDPTQPLRDAGLPVPPLPPAVPALRPDVPQEQADDWRERLRTVLLADHPTRDDAEEALMGLVDEVVAVAGPAAMIYPTQVALGLGPLAAAISLIGHLVPGHPSLLVPEHEWE